MTGVTRPDPGAAAGDEDRAHASLVPLEGGWAGDPALRQPAELHIMRAGVRARQRTCSPVRAPPAPPRIPPLGSGRSDFLSLVTLPG